MRRCEGRNPERRRPIRPVVLSWQGTSPSFTPEPSLELAVVGGLDDLVRPSAAKDRTFKTVRPNQGTARGLFRSADGRRCESP
jgi:hypothetical protein